MLWVVVWAIVFANITENISRYKAQFAVCEKSWVTDLTGLLVRDTLRDSRQLSSFSSVMPERSSWTYSWDESVDSCLLFLSPPWKQNINRTVIRLPWYTINTVMWSKTTMVINNKRNLWTKGIHVWFASISSQIHRKVT